MSRRSSQETVGAGPEGQRESPRTLDRIDRQLQYVLFGIYLSILILLSLVIAVGILLSRPTQSYAGFDEEAFVQKLHTLYGNESMPDRQMNFAGASLLRVGMSQVPEAERGKVWDRFFKALVSANSELNQESGEGVKVLFPKWRSSSPWGVLEYRPYSSAKPYRFLIHFIDEREGLETMTNAITIRFWIGQPQTGEKWVDASDNRWSNQSWETIRRVLEETVDRVFEAIETSLEEPDSGSVDDGERWMNLLEIEIGNEPYEPG